MAKISSPMVFEYTPNPELDEQENMKSIITDIVEKTMDGVPFKIQLIIPGVQLDAAEQRKLIEDARELAIKMEQSEMIPVSVDKDGNTLYQRQDVVVKE